MHDDPFWKLITEYGGFGEFRPGLFYYSNMDYLLLLLEDVGFVSEWLPGGVIELLYHPHEKRLVGVKINGASTLSLGRLGELIDRVMEAERAK